MKSRFEIASPVIAEEMRKPYQYGVSDCFFLGCRVADAFEPERNLSSKYSGTYKTLLGAQRAMKKRGFNSIASVFRNHLEEITPAQCQYGDIAVLLLDNIEHVAICVGERFLTRTEKGRALHSLSEVKAAFRS